jgi:hypothetical protein
MQFIPTNQLPNVSGHVPYFEESKDFDIPGRRTQKELSRLQNEVATEIAELGGLGIRFLEGKYSESDRVRHGYQIIFSLYGNMARIDVAALPLQTYTTLKRDAAMRQALYLLRDWLAAERQSWLYRPSAMPLLPYVMNGEGKTVIEVLAASGNLPLLGSGS